MDETQMRELIDRHIDAESRGDVDGAVAVYTEDIDHDVVGFPDGHSRGKDGARAFYAYLTTNFLAQKWTLLHRYVSDDAIVLEQKMTGAVVGSMLGLEGHGRQISFRMMHVFEFRDGLISRENIWVDTAAVIDQLS